MTLAETLSLYAAIVSTTALVVSISLAYERWLRYREDRPRIDVACRIVEGWTPGVGKTMGPLLGYTVTNSGGRSVVITGVGGHWKDGERTTGFFLPDAKLPKRLDPYDSELFLCDLTILDRAIVFLGVWDSKGVAWKAPQKQVDAALADRKKDKPA